MSWGSENSMFEELIDTKHNFRNRNQVAMEKNMIYEETGLVRQHIDEGLQFQNSYTLHRKLLVEYIQNPS